MRNESLHKKYPWLGGLFQIAFAIGLCIAMFTMQQCNIFRQSDPTTLEIHNESQTDTVLVYLTISPGKGFVSDVNGIFGISSTKKTQGAFYLDPGATVKYEYAGLAISGNISFWQAPVNCPYPGITLYEFTLNNKGTVKKAQETFDISCVAGVTTLGSITGKGGGAWTNGRGDTVVTVQNGPLYTNTGLSGVFPYGCTGCIDTSGATKCKGSAAFAKPNKHNICNISRDASLSGGSVRITYIDRQTILSDTLETGCIWPPN